MLFNFSELTNPCRYLMWIVLHLTEKQSFRIQCMWEGPLPTWALPWLSSGLLFPPSVILSAFVWVKFITWKKKKISKNLIQAIGNTSKLFNIFNCIKYIKHFYRIFREMQSLPCHLLCILTFCATGYEPLPSCFLPFYQEITVSLLRVKFFKVRYGVKFHVNNTWEAKAKQKWAQRILVTSKRKEEK